MKELDLSNATVLKWILSFKYHGWEIREISDICSLTRKTLLALVELISCICIVVIAGSVLLYIAGIILSPLTLFLPTAFYAPVPMIQAGIFSTCLIGIFLAIGLLIQTLQGEIPLIKVKSREKSSKTILAVREMYKSLKDKTCIKVKL